MLYEEYKQKLEELTFKFDNEKNALAKEFAISNSPYKVGDILQDHYQIIQVESIVWAWSYATSSTPECVYCGIRLTKGLKPCKEQDTIARMYQSNVLRKLN